MVGDMAYHPHEITLKTFQQILSQYEDHVDGKLEELDARRYTTIGQSICSRSPPSLDKAELLALVSWKMLRFPNHLLHIMQAANTCARKHGTWRPNLAKLAESNADNTVTNQSKVAISCVADGIPTAAALKSALKALTELRGVGPATASLILSCYRPDCVPFFSDELFRWLHWDDERKGKGTGWKAQIAYTITEYVSLAEKAQGLCTRLKGKSADNSPWMLELEKVAYVIGREQIDVTQGAAEGSDEDGNAPRQEDSRELPKTDDGAAPTDKPAQLRKIGQGNAGKKRDRDSIAIDAAASNRRSRRVKQRQL